MSRRSWLKRAAAWALLACLGLAAGCGVKGRPKAPDQPVIPGL